MPNKPTPEQEMARRTRRSFLALGAKARWSRRVDGNG